MGLSEGDEGDAEFGAEDAAKVAIGDAEPGGDAREADFFECAALDHGGGRVGDAMFGVDAGIAGCEFGTAAQAGAVAGGFGGGGAWKERAVGGLGRSTVQTGRQ